MYAFGILAPVRLSQKDLDFAVILRYIESLKQEWVTCNLGENKQLLTFTKLKKIHIKQIDQEVLSLDGKNKSVYKVFEITLDLSKINLYYVKQQFSDLKDSIFTSNF